MHTLIQSPAMKVQIFLTNRVLRIFIPYLPAFLGLTLVYLAVPSVAQGGIKLNLSYYVYNIFLLPRVDLTSYVPVVAWTLTHELVFYLLFALLIISRNKVGYWLFGLWMAACFASFFAPNAVDDSGPMILKPINLAFGFGVLAQLGSTRTLESIKGGVWMTGAILFMGSMAFDTSLRNVSILHELTYLTGAALMCSGIGGVRFKFLERAGDLSYSLYLVHYPILAATFIFLPKVTGGYDVNVYLFLAGAFVIVYAASFIYHRIFEKILYKHIRARLSKR